MGLHPVTAVANSVYRHDQSIGLRICDSDPAWRRDWYETALRHAGSTSVVVFGEGHSLKSAGSWSCKKLVSILNISFTDVAHLTRDGVKKTENFHL